MRNYLYRALLCLGYVDQARVRREEALAEARRVSPFNVAYAVYHACITYWAIGGVEAVPTLLRSADEILAISSEHGFALWSAIGKMIRGWCLGAMGQAAEGIELLIEGLADARTIGCGAMLPFYVTTLGEIYGMAGQPDEGLKRLAEAAEMIERTQERWAEAETYRLRGVLLLSMNNHAAAEESYRQALAVARRQSARFWELRAATNLACLWRDQGKRDAARDLLAPVYNWFREGLDTPVVKGAKALLDQLSA